MAKEFTIKAQEKIEVWQECTYKVVADNLEEAKKKIQTSPLTHAIEAGEILPDTEKVLEVAFDAICEVEEKEL